MWILTLHQHQPDFYSPKTKLYQCGEAIFNKIKYNPKNKTIAKQILTKLDTIQKKQNNGQAGF